MGTMKSAAKNMMREFAYGNGATAAVRVFLGLMLLWSGVIKALDTEVFGALIMRYRIIPDILVPYPAIVIPYLEIVLGLFIVAGYKIRAAASISVLMMIFYAFALSVNLVRGETFDCGCLHLDMIGPGLDERIGIHLVVRNVILSLLFILLYHAKNHVRSVEQYLEKRGLLKLH